MKKDKERRELISREIAGKDETVKDFAFNWNATQLTKYQYAFKVLGVEDTSLGKFVCNAIKDLGVAQGMKHASELTQLGFKAGKERHAKGFRWRKTEIVDRFYKPDAPTAFIRGDRGAGKTDFAILLAELGLQMDKIDTVLTNIACEYDRVTKYTVLQERLQDTKDRVLFIYDEAGVSADSRTPMSKLNRKLKKLGRLARKYHLSLIIISQRYSDVDKALRNIVNVRVKKLGKKRAMLDFTHDKYPEVFVTSVPGTGIEFDSYDIAPFELGDIEEAEEKKEAVQKYILKRIHNLKRNKGKTWQEVSNILSMDDKLDVDWTTGEAALKYHGSKCGCDIIPNNKRGG